MARSHKALQEFLLHHAKIKPVAWGANGVEENCYVLKTEDCLFFMAESHLREIHNALNQPGTALHASDYARLVVARSWDPPERGFDRIRIPVKAVDLLDARQALVLLRNLEGIQKDIDEGRRLRQELEELFGDAAHVQSFSDPAGDRIFKITGRLSSKDTRRYAERYAEQVAANTLFDVAKALNAQLRQLHPEALQEKLFIEGRDFSDRKIRYGSEVNTELELTDDGAWTYTSLAKQDPQIRQTLQRLFHQAMVDPFGLSLKHYMGKHNVMKAGKRPLLKLQGFSGIWNWIRGRFNRKKSPSIPETKE